MPHEEIIKALEVRANKLGVKIGIELPTAFLLRADEVIEGVSRAHAHGNLMSAAGGIPVFRRARRDSLDSVFPRLARCVISGGAVR